MGRFAAVAARSKFANTVITTYKAYLDNPSIAKQDNPILNRPPNKRLFIVPFTRVLPANYYLIVGASVPAVTAYLLAVNTGAGVRTKEELTVGTDFTLKLEGYKPARVQIKTGRLAQGNRTISKTSGLPYKNYGGHSISIPFGRGVAAENEEQAFAAIRTEILSGASATNPPLITLIPEKRGSV